MEEVAAVAAEGLCNQFSFPRKEVSSTPGPDFKWAKAWPALVFIFGGGARRSSLLGKEGSEDEGGEGKLGGEGGENRKENNP